MPKESTSLVSGKIDMDYSCVIKSLPNNSDRRIALGGPVMAQRRQAASTPLTLAIPPATAHETTLKRK